MSIKILETTIRSLPSLQLKENKREIHRVRKGGWGGSMWITRRKGGYRILLTGEVASRFRQEMRRLFGDRAGIDRRYEYWYLSGDQALLESLAALDRI